MTHEYVDTDLAWARLAAAIIESGKTTNDKVFLESNWYKTLCSMVLFYVNRHNFGF